MELQSAQGPQQQQQQQPQQQPPPPQQQAAGQAGQQQTLPLLLALPLVLSLVKADRREAALLELSKRRET